MPLPILPENHISNLNFFLTFLNPVDKIQIKSKKINLDNNTLIVKLPFYDNKIYYADQSIKKIKYILQNEIYTDGLFEISFSNNQKKIYAISKEIISNKLKSLLENKPKKGHEFALMDLYNQYVVNSNELKFENQVDTIFFAIASQFFIFFLSFGIVENAFLNQKEHNIFSWDKISSNDIYTKYSNSSSHNNYPEFFYTAIHKKLSYLIKNDLKKFKLDPNIFPLEICSLGTAEGGDLKSIANDLALPATQTYISGIDINKQNITKAKETYPAGHFIEGSVEDYLSLIKKNLSDFPKNRIKIIICSGILAKTILPGTRKAINILQQITRNQPHLVYITSLTESFITTRIAKNVGFKLTNIESAQSLENIKADKYTSPIMSFALQSQEERVAHLIKVSNKRSATSAPNCLDLSMSANPISDIKLLSEKTNRLTEVTQLDLSWCFLENKQEIYDLIKEIQSHMPKLKFIILSRNESWCETLILSINDTVKNKYSFYERKDFANNEQVSAFSVRQARDLDIYQPPQLVKR